MRRLAAAPMLHVEMLRRSNSPNLTDEDLVTLAGNGDVNAFEAVFDRHAAVAFSLAYRICGRRELAERIVRDAFLMLWRTGAVHDPSAGSVRSWILSFVHERAVDALAPLRAAERAGRLTSPATPPQARAIGPRDLLLARRALEQLPVQQRQMIELAYFGGFTRRRIAEILELPDNAVAGSLRNGLHALQAVLEARNESARIADSGQLSPLDAAEAPSSGRRGSAGSSSRDAARLTAGHHARSSEPARAATGRPSPGQGAPLL